MGKPIFVVQKHNASHLHYDFRLSMNGVLKSWAIPKQPSKDSKVRRLAIQVEDHPLSYANFEGTIEEGHYGAGKVKIWDKGRYSLIEKSRNKIVVDLEGKRLKGKYALVKFAKSGGKNWLFFRMRK